MGKLKEELLKSEYHSLIAGEIPLLDYIYVIPTRRKHDSGYMCMEIIGESLDTGFKKKLAVYSDVFDICEIITNRHQYYTISMDIPEYGVMRFFSQQNKFEVTCYGVSSFGFNIIERNK